MDLKLNASVAEFFQDRVSEAIRNQRVDATTPTECYLVSLLADFTKSPPDDQPLALKLAAAVNSPDERVRQLKDVGDTSLYVSGFFADSLQRKLVDVDYYIDMGGAAYGRLSASVRGTLQGRALSAVFAELAEKFREFVDVLTEIRASGSAAAFDVLRLYEVWLKTGSRRAAQLLREHGIEPNATLNAATRH